jgi:outer membrane protein OmpA-like peptidoglycan-associated protein
MSAPVEAERAGQDPRSRAPEDRAAPGPVDGVDPPGTARYAGDLGPREQYERQRYFMPEGGVGFAFDAVKPVDGEVERWLAGLPEGYRQALGDPRTVVTLHVSASQPGTERYNHQLTDKRGAALARELEDRGVAAQIRIRPLGESLAGRAATLAPTSLLGDGGRPATHDDARFRTARIVIEPHAGSVAVEPEKIQGQRPDGARLRETLERGERVFEEKIAKTLGEKVRTIIPPRENPLLPTPSRDPKEFAGQLAQEGYDWATGAREKAAEMAVGILGDGAYLEMQEEVARKREPLFRAAAEGVAAGLDPDHAERSRWQPRSEQERALFQEARRQVEGMTAPEKEQLGLFLTQWATQFETSFDYLLSEAGGPSYRKGVTDFFASDKHFHRQ